MVVETENGFKHVVEIHTSSFPGNPEPITYPYSVYDARAITLTRGWVPYPYHRSLLYFQSSTTIQVWRRNMWWASQVDITCPPNTRANDNSGQHTPWRVARRG